jgi:hypothetical protein
MKKRPAHLQQQAAQRVHREQTVPTPTIEDGQLAIPLGRLFHLGCHLPCGAGT